MTADSRDWSDSRDRMTVKIGVTVVETGVTVETVQTGMIGVTVETVETGLTVVSRN